VTSTVACNLLSRSVHQRECRRLSASVCQLPPDICVQLDSLHRIMQHPYVSLECLKNEPGLYVTCDGSPMLKVKRYRPIALVNKSSQSYEASICRMGSHSVTCHPTQVNTLRRNPSQTGWYSIYLPRMDRVDL